MNPATLWWMEETAAGRRFQRQVLPKSALLPKARREAEEDECEEEARLAKFRRGVPGESHRGVPGGNPTRRRQS